ncbi:type II toxin-antitoxin system RelE/ParE family toxin [Xanthobacter versatilis]|uniref:type II toxin-antitoxin system RelE/ParE family toxin n=1 Tax=Xanthobacter autotrophicus (strain ATCC BAA-1158 / Py2) TaxID=78245 RepID=UPI003735BF7E
MRIVFRARALRYLREIDHHIGQDNPKAAARVIVRLETAINTLPTIPFPPCRDCTRNTPAHCFR